MDARKTLELSRLWWAARARHPRGPKAPPSQLG